MEGSYTNLFTGSLMILLLWLQSLSTFILQRRGNRKQEFRRRLLNFFSQEELERGRSYSSKHRNLSFLEHSITLPVMGLFLFTGWLADIENWTRQLSSFWLLSHFIFIFLLVLTSSLLSAPSSLYRTFKIEKEEGFNQQTPALWFKDQLKGIALGSLILWLLSAAIMSVIRHYEESWWVIGAVIISVFSLFMNYIAPIWLMPIFNKFETLDNPSLNEKIREIGEKAGIRINKIFTMDASKRSKHSNAFFAGMGSTKRVVLFDTLLEQHSEEEILSILAHEMGHWKKKHIQKGTLLSVLFSFAGFYFLYRISDWSFALELFHIKTTDTMTFLISALFLFQFISMLIDPISSFFSRKNEREADAVALKLYPNGDAQAQAMIRLVKENRSDLLGHPFVQALHASHPHPLERIEYALRMKAVLR